MVSLARYLLLRDLVTMSRSAALCLLDMNLTNLARLRHRIHACANQTRLARPVP